MTEQIGDIEVGAFEGVTPAHAKNVEQRQYIGMDDRVVVEMDEDLEDVTIRAILDERLHSSDASVSLQRENIHALIRRGTASNSLDRLDWTGWFQVNNIGIPRSDTYTSGQMVGEFYPYGEFKPGLWVKREITDNEFGLERPGVFVLPTNVQRPEVWSKTDASDISSDSSIDTRDGTVDRYRLWSYFDPDEQNGTFGFREEYGWVREARLLSQGDTVTTTGVDAPAGSYRMKARLSDNDVSDDIKLLVEDSSQTSLMEDSNYTGSTSITVVESKIFKIPQDETVDLTVEKATSDSNTIRVDGYWLEPAYVPAAMFDVDLSGDFHAPNTVSPVRVFDDYGNGSRADWQKVHNIEHAFDGQPVIENGIIQVNFGDGSIKSRRGGSYQNFVNTGTYALDFLSWSLRELGPERVVFRGRLEDADGNHWVGDFSLDRGTPSLRIDVMQSSTVAPTYVELDKHYAHGASIGKMFSGDQYSGSESIPDTDNWVAGVAQDHISVFGSSAKTLNQFYLSGDITRVGYDISEGDTLYIGAYDFPDGTYLTDTTPASSAGNVAEYEYAAGSDLPHGAYLIGWRVRSDNGESVSITAEVDGNDVSVDEKGTSWNTATTTSYEYYLRYYDTGSDGSFRSEVTSSSPSAIEVDEVVLLPLALEGNIGVQDVAHELLTKLDTKPTLQQR